LYTWVLVGLFSWSYVLGKEMVKIKPCTYHICTIRNWIIMVWMVWLNAGSALWRKE
jgi:hypothetical protein